jgi:hypothetical protein
MAGATNRLIFIDPCRSIRNDLAGYLEHQKAIEECLGDNRNQGVPKSLRTSSARKTSSSRELSSASGRTRNMSRASGSRPPSASGRLTGCFGSKSFAGEQPSSCRLTTRSPRDR